MIARCFLSVFLRRVPFIRISRGGAIPPQGTRDPGPRPRECHRGDWLRPIRAGIPFRHVADGRGVFSESFTRSRGFPCGPAPSRRSIAIDPLELDDLFEYQKSSVVHFDEEKSHRIALGSNLPKYLRGALFGEPVPLRTGPFRYLPRSNDDLAGNRERDTGRRRNLSRVQRAHDPPQSESAHSKAACSAGKHLQLFDYDFANGHTQRSAS